MERIYDLVEFNFNKTKRKRVVCDGPDGPNILTAMLNCSLLKSGAPLRPASRPYFKEEEIRTSLSGVLKLNIFLKSKSEVEEEIPREIFGRILENLGPQELVTPKLSR